MKYLLMSFCFWLASGQISAAELCPAAAIADLQSALKQKPAAELVFFASWCVSCKKHLQELKDDQILIASFDEKEAAEKVLLHLVKAPEKTRCWWDRDGSIVKHYDVTGLPAKRSIK